MKITYCKHVESGYISMVQTLDYYIQKGKTEEEVVKAIESNNGTHKEYQWYVEEVSDSIGEVFKFVLGEDQYKASYDIGKLVRKIKSFQEDIENLEDDVRDIYRVTEDMQSDLKKVLKNYEELEKED